LVSLHLHQRLAAAFTAAPSEDKLTVGGERADIVLTFAKSGDKNAEFLGAYEVAPDQTTYEQWKRTYNDSTRQVPASLHRFVDEEASLIEGLGMSTTPNPDYNFYNLKPSPEVLGGLESRLVIRWPDPFVNWVRRTGTWPDGAHTQFEVVAIRPPGFVKPFPGFEQVDLAWEELRKMHKQAAGNQTWHQKLSTIAGVYLITDTSSAEGHLYVGSASGKHGVWSRWSDYVTPPFHGGNKALQRRLDANPSAHKHWRFSLLEVMSPTSHQNDVLAAENRWKQRLGTRAHGLNHN